MIVLPSFDDSAFSVFSVFSVKKSRPFEKGL
jgi:hypothetical protein